VTLRGASVNITYIVSA